MHLCPFCNRRIIKCTMMMMMIVPHQIIWSWYTGRWWVGCYISYSEEGTGQGPNPPRPLLVVPNVTAHPSTASVPITVLLYDGPLLCGFNVGTKGLSIPTISFENTPQPIVDWTLCKLAHISKCALQHGDNMMTIRTKKVNKLLWLLFVKYQNQNCITATSFEMVSGFKQAFYRKSRRNAHKS